MSEKVVRPDVERFKAHITAACTGGDWRKGRAIDQLLQWIDHLEHHEELMRRVLETTAALLKYAERNECHHEETHRAGFIWTICDQCGRRWADDKGGFGEYQEPTAITDVRAALDAAQEESR